jgi:hypothetical protein
MIKLFSYLLFFSCAFYSKAQENLIKNLSVEIFSGLPNNLAGYDFCVDWWKPYIWTTDYFTSQTSNSSNNYVPQNSFGNQSNIDGDFYLGIVVMDWIYNLNDCYYCKSDYAAGKFFHSLKKDKVYLFEFWVSKAEKGVLKSNALDLLLTYDTVVDVNNYTPYGYKIWSEQIPMEDTLNWVKISACFKAIGNEKAFAIGNFHSESEVINIVAYDSTTSGEIDYRYLDNFSLIECPSCCPDQFEDEPLVYVFSNPSTFGNPASLELWLHQNTTGILELYDGAGRLVAKENYSNLQNTFLLERFAKGMYHFVYQTSDGVIETGKVLVIE